ncbi:MAG: RNA 2'-phosphotransferase [Candidatus Hadarchaeota archaeon]
MEIDDIQRDRLSRLMAYHLRHDPDIERTAEGFVEVEKLTQILREKAPWVEPSNIREIAIFDPRGRYELKGRLIRARYGHSVDVKLDFPEANVDMLYHCTSPEMVAQILAEGLKPMDRKMVHLSAKVENALEVGGRHTAKPAVLVVDVRKAKERGVKIVKASEKVYLADRIPAECLKTMEKSGA